MIEAELSRSVARWCKGATGVTGAAKLSGGASQETWRFDITHPDGPIGAILRRSPKGYGAAPTRAAGLAAEAQLMQLAYEAGVPSPRVMHGVAFGGGFQLSLGADMRFLSADARMKL